MALRRVRSKHEPHFDSVVADETIARWPDDWDVIEGDPEPAATPAVEPPPTSAPSRPRTPTSYDDYR